MADVRQSAFAAAVAVPPSECRVRARNRTSFPTWISSLKRTFHPVCGPRRPRRARAAHDRRHRAMQGGSAGICLRVNFCRGFLYKMYVNTIRSLAKSPGFHRSCRRPRWRLGSEQTLPFSRSCMECCCGPSTIQKPRSADVSDGRSSGHWGHRKVRSSAPEYIEFPPDEPIVRGGWRLFFDRRRGVHQTDEVNLTTGESTSCGCARSPSMHIC